MADDFPLQLKSTLDKLVFDKTAELRAKYPTLEWAEVDDMSQTDEIFKSAEPRLLWQFGTLYEHPRAPLYGLQFFVGAKTTQDPGNYTLLDLLSQIRDVFKPQASYPIFDYTMAVSDPSDLTERGFITVSSNEIASQQFDRQSGVRYAVIEARAVRYG